MPTYSDWFELDPYTGHPYWDWFERGVSPGQDVYRGTTPTSAGMQEASTGFGMDVDVAGYARLAPPNMARTVLAYAAHDVVPAADTLHGVEQPADHAQYHERRIAEVHIQSYSDALPSIDVPPGAEIQWEGNGEWVGPATVDVAWSVRAGHSGGLGSNQAVLCRVPLSGTTVSDQGRTDLTTWVPLVTISDPSPVNVATLENPVRSVLNAGAPHAGVHSFITSDDVLCLGLRAPEMLTELGPGPYPLTVPFVGGNFDGPSAWDLYGVGAQIQAVTISRLFQPPRYRFVNLPSGMWRLRQRQSAQGADGWSLRQRQHANASGSWPLRQRQARA